MSDDALRLVLTRAVEQLREATDLTMDEIIGIRALPASVRTLPESALTRECMYSLGIIEGAAAALRATPRELLADHELLNTAGVSPSL